MGDYPALPIQGLIAKAHSYVQRLTFCQGQHPGVTLPLTGFPIVMVAWQYLRPARGLDLLQTYNVRLQCLDRFKSVFPHAGRKAIDVPAYDYHCHHIPEGLLSSYLITLSEVRHHHLDVRTPI